MKINLLKKFFSKNIKTITQSIWIVFIFASSLSRAEIAAQEKSWLPLLNIIQERLITANEVAKYKWHKNLAISDLQREKKMIQQQSKIAKILNLNFQHVATVFSDQIEASKLIQNWLLFKWQSEPKNTHKPIKSLNELRKTIDTLNHRLMHSLVASSYLEHQTNCQKQLNNDINLIIKKNKLEVYLQLALVHATIHLCQK